MNDLPEEMDSSSDSVVSESTESLHVPSSWTYILSIFSHSASFPTHLLSIFWTVHFLLFSYLLPRSNFVLFHKILYEYLKNKAMI